MLGNFKGVVGDKIMSSACSWELFSEFREDLEDDECPGKVKTEGKN